MEYTDEQIEEALSGAMMPQDLGESDGHYLKRKERHLKYAKTIMRMVREEIGSVMSYSEHRIKLQGAGPPLPEFWKEPQKPAAESQWRPIETLPANDKMVLLVGKHKRPSIGWREAWSGNIYWDNLANCQPTHWTPIPELPR